MSRKDTIDQLTGDVALMGEWRLLIKSGRLEQMLTLANCFRGEYSKTQKSPSEPHIRQEQNGGMRAWDKLEYLLMSLPFKEQSVQQSDDQEYIGFVQDHVATNMQNQDIGTEEEY